MADHEDSGRAPGGGSPGSSGSIRAAVRSHHEVIDLAEIEVDPVAAGLVDPRVLRRHGALPVRFEGGNLVVAMRDPADLCALEDLSMLSGHRVSGLAADPEQIERAANTHFAIGDGITGSDQDGGSGLDDNVLDLGAPQGEEPVVRLV